MAWTMLVAWTASCHSRSKLEIKETLRYVFRCQQIKVSRAGSQGGAGKKEGRFGTGSGHPSWEWAAGLRPGALGASPGGPQMGL